MRDLKKETLKQKEHLPFTLGVVLVAQVEHLTE
jgi:hypothetical protein